MTTVIVLNPGAGQVQKLDTDSGIVTTVIQSAGDVPDGIAVDYDSEFIYWTNMGSPVGSLPGASLTEEGISFAENNGSLERSRFDGSERETIVPPGSFVTGKQLTFDSKTRTLYFCDREGMRVFRVNSDGSDLVTLVQTGDHHVPEELNNVERHCVGIAVDSQSGYLYWTQKGPSKGGRGRIFRAPLEIPHNAVGRDDVETLWEDLPEPIDLYLDLAAGHIYWTDRGAEPGGNTLNRADIPALGEKGRDPQILASGFQEAIGVDRDVATGNFYVTDLGGNIRQINPETGIDKVLITLGGALTGIAVVPE